MRQALIVGMSLSLVVSSAPAGAQHADPSYSYSNSYHSGSSNYSSGYNSNNYTYADVISDLAPVAASAVTSLSTAVYSKASNLLRQLKERRKSSKIARSSESPAETDYSSNQNGDDVSSFDMLGEAGVKANRFEQNGEPDSGLSANEPGEAREQSRTFERIAASSYDSGGDTANSDAMSSTDRSEDGPPSREFEQRVAKKDYESYDSDEMPQNADGRSDLGGEADTQARKLNETTARVFRAVEEARSRNTASDGEAMVQFRKFEQTLRKYHSPPADDDRWGLDLNKQASKPGITGQSAASMQLRIDQASRPYPQPAQEELTRLNPRYEDEGPAPSRSIPQYNSTTSRSTTPVLPDDTYNVPLTPRYDDEWGQY